MHAASFLDDINTRYFYLHTKGITHINSPCYNNIIDWVKLMLYWNIEKWKDNFLWFQEMFCKYDIHPFNLYLLES